MKIAVGDGGIPADADAVADADFQLAHEDGVGEAALMADADLCGFGDGELHAVHDAIVSDHKSAEKSFECGSAFDDRIAADGNARGQFSVFPAAFHIGSALV